ncbi:MAG: hypothetical protein ACK419_04210 [Pyrinomonadaceae bacterium]
MGAFFPVGLRALFEKLLLEGLIQLLLVGQSVLIIYLKRELFRLRFATAITNLTN